MNDKIQAILLKIILDLKKMNWAVAPDWELTLKGEGHAPLSRNIPVQGNMGDDEWTDDIETTIDLKLVSNDEITFFPEFTIYATIFITGGASQDIAYKLDSDAAFTERDFNDVKKAEIAAKRISRSVEDYIESQYDNYVANNQSNIMAYKQGGWKEDDLDV